MSYFIGNIYITRDIWERKYFYLHKPFTFVSKKYGIEIDVEKGFKTDGNTTPKWACFISVPYAYDVESAVIHDALLSVGYDRKIAANIFRECMEARKVCSWRRWIKYIAVKYLHFFPKYYTEKEINYNKKFVHIQEIKHG